MKKIQSKEKEWANKDTPTPTDDRAIGLLWNKNFCLDTPRTDRTDSTDGREYGIS